MSTRTAGPSLVTGEGLAPALPSLDDVRSVAGIVERRIGAWYYDPYDIVPTRRGDAALGYELELSAGAFRVRARELHPLQDTARDWREPEPVLFHVEGDPVAPAQPLRGQIAEWSKKSRARMAYTMAGLDLSSWSDDGRRALMFITLTLPGEWEAIAPTGKEFKKLVKRFRERWREELGAMRGVWKLEFQERGAPHLHILTTAPVRIRRRLAYKWIAQQWVAACAHPDKEQRYRQLRAHDFSNEDHPTGCVEIVDQWADHKKMAVYFNKHSAKTRDAKEYQHNVPALWRRPGAGPGRFWGVWGLKRARCTVPVDRRVAAGALRIARKIAQGRNADHQLRVLRHAQIPVSRARVSRLRRPRAMAGMWILVSDGLQLALDLSRVLSLERT